MKGFVKKSYRFTLRGRETVAVWEWKIEHDGVILISSESDSYYQAKVCIGSYLHDIKFINSWIEIECNNDDDPPF